MKIELFALLLAAGPRKVLTIPYDNFAFFGFEGVRSRTLIRKGSRITHMLNLAKRTAVYLKSDYPVLNPARHSASKTLTLLILALPAARWTDNRRNAIQLTTNETWKEVKRRARPDDIINAVIPSVLKPRRAPESLMLSYPPMPQETDGRKRQRELWLRAERF